LHDREGVEVFARGEGLEVVVPLEQPADAAADELVVGEQEPHRHPAEATIARECLLVLIVDDNGPNRKLARDVLRSGGFTTLEAESAGEGIALATEHRPDVVLMDLRLPDMNGADAARQLARTPRAAGIPIVALTSSVVGGGGAWIREAGFAGYLEKPISVREFAGQVREYCLGGGS
jgi:two-component system cell cycle response regulator DivK